VKPRDFIVQTTCRICGGAMTLVDDDKDELYRVINYDTLKRHRS